MKNFIFMFLLLNSCLLMAVFPDLNFEEACEKAKASNKIIIVDFYTVWCGPCKKLDKTTWKDKKVISWLTKYSVSLKVDAEKQKQLAKKYKVKAYPTIIFIDILQKEMGRIVGYRNAQDFISEATQILDGKDNLTRAKDKFLSGDKNDPRNIMKYARVLRQERKYDKALKKFLWCFDHAVDTKGFSGVRRSFLLSDIYSMKEEYPLAVVELKNRMLVCKNELQQKPDNQNLYDLIALTDTLKEQHHLVEIYSFFKKQQLGAYKKKLGTYLLDYLLSQKKYNDIIDDTPNILKHITKKIDRFHENKKMGFYSEDITPYMKNNIVKTGGKYYEVLLAIGNKAQATLLAKKIIIFYPKVATYQTLITHAKNIQDKEAENFLREKVISLLQSEQQKTHK
ncbi:thioredoxin family protein [Candidatus Uabimicrobium sp. HlEnr_7]|uniref:thioredoxin family protein n=1 Tax=Candidatus Uabimicrobium helgolandensis TaxID=3095367 RepID=UPI003556A24F